MDLTTFEICLILAIPSILTFAFLVTKEKKALRWVLSYLVASPTIAFGITWVVLSTMDKYTNFYIYDSTWMAAFLSAIPGLTLATLFIRKNRKLKLETANLRPQIEEEIEPAKQLSIDVGLFDPKRSARAQENIRSKSSTPAD